MRASRNWGACSCNCGKNIETGQEFVIVRGAMYLVGHEGKATQQIPVVKRDRGRAAKDGDRLEGLPLFEKNSGE